MNLYNGRAVSARALPQNPILKPSRDIDTLLCCEGSAKSGAGPIELKRNPANVIVPGQGTMSGSPALDPRNLKAFTHNCFFRNVQAVLKQQMVLSSWSTTQPMYLSRGRALGETALLSAFRGKMKRQGGRAMALDPGTATTTMH